jgi:hypothetical protein
MFSWIWGCMILTFKVALGGFFWVISFYAFALIMAGLAFGLSGEWKKPKKPKYEGQPIIVKGGKKDE